MHTGPGGQPGLRTQAPGHGSQVKLRRATGTHSQGDNTHDNNQVQKIGVRWGLGGPGNAAQSSHFSSEWPSGGGPPTCCSTRSFKHSSHSPSSPVASLVCNGQCTKILLTSPLRTLSAHTEQCDFLYLTCYLCLKILS